MNFFGVCTVAVGAALASLRGVAVENKDLEHLLNVACLGAQAQTLQAVRMEENAMAQSIE